MPKSSFEPIHLKEVNKKLQRDILSETKQNEKQASHEETVMKTSLWHKFVGLFAKK